MAEKITKAIIITIFTIFTVIISFGHVYTVKDTGSGLSYQVLTFKEIPVSSVIQRAQLSLRSEDVVEPSLDTTLDSGTITIIRSRPIEVTLDKTIKTYYTTKLYVGDFLKEIGITLNEKDYINIPEYAELDTNKIIIKRYVEKPKLVKEQIPYETIYVKDPMVAEGVTYLKQDGAYGTKTNYYKEIYFGGDKIKEVFEKSVITKMPTTKIYVVGSAKPPKEYVKTMEVLATAYSPTVWETDSNPWVTASGLRSRYGIVAVDPSVIPMGTLLYVENYGYAVAGDTGGAIKGNKIDVFFYNPYEASKWGVRKVKIYILNGKWKFPSNLKY